MATGFVEAVNSGRMTARTTTKGTTGRFIPSAYTMRREFEGGVIYYSPDKRHAIAYRGRRTHPDWHYRMRSDEEFWQVTNKFVQSIEKEVQRKKERQSIDIREHVKEGDVFVNVWGFDQTNVDAYQVVRVIGKRMVELREIATAPVKGTDGFMSDRVVPLRDDFIREETLRKRVSIQKTSDGEIAAWIAFEFGGCGKWDGQREYYRSWYA